MPYPFNVRVYGLLLDDKNRVLVADELIHEHYITKFPGGGLEFGEGTIEAIKREMMEETGITIDVVSHFYTTDFFQLSAFNSKAQVISIYYIIKELSPYTIQTSDKPFDFAETKEGAISFRWLPINSLSEDMFTFPIDKKVSVLLRNFDISSKT
ncbi:MAG TPA: NUDIX domain-containing protein [Bacteroidia bacterium]|jgi:8-oxo-dGTP diphosphatase|nr:NUDIX domain-containing protein [Bacteroidia bacterium]